MLTQMLEYLAGSHHSVLNSNCLFFFLVILNELVSVFKALSGSGLTYTSLLTFLLVSKERLL